MDVSLRFLGATYCVTGSKYLLTLEGNILGATSRSRHQVLIDYGLFQGLKELRLRNREGMPFNPGELAAAAPVGPAAAQR